MSFDAMKTAAENGDASAQSALGYAYDVGEGVTQNLETAVYWYRQAAEQGYATAQINLAEMIRDGAGVTQSSETALEWYTKAAMQGNSRAQYNVAMMHVQGEGVPADNVTAYAWLVLSATGDAEGASQARDIVGKGIGDKIAEGDALAKRLSAEIQANTNASVASQPTLPTNTSSIATIESLEDQWLVGQIPLKDGTLFVRLNQAAKPYIAHPKLAIKLGFAIPFNAEPKQGLPNPTENEVLADLEDEIRNLVKASTTGIHVLTLTAPEVKELMFYIDEGADIGALHESIRAQTTSHEVQCMAVRDPEWKSYREFLPPNEG